MIKGAPKGPSDAAPIAIIKTVEKTEPKPADPPPTMVTPDYVPTPKEGEGTIVVNVLNASAKVSLVTNIKRGAVNIEGKGQISGGSTATIGGTRVENVQIDTRLLCASTPCAFSLPVGSSTLHIEAPAKDGWDSSTDLYDITVVPGKAKLVTHIMTREKTVVITPARRSKGLLGDILLETLGWSAVGVGIPIAAVSSPEAGGITAGIGLAMIIAGVVMYDPGSAQHNEHTFAPGATSFSDYPPR